MQSLRGGFIERIKKRSHCETTSKQPRVERSVTRTTYQIYININKNVDVIYRFLQIFTGSVLRTSPEFGLHQVVSQ